MDYIASMIRFFMQSSILLVILIQGLKNLLSIQAMQQVCSLILLKRSINVIDFGFQCNPQVS
jgi:hypothetical protein